MVVGLASAVLLFLAWGADGVPLAGAVAMLLPLAVVPAVSLFTAGSGVGSAAME